MIMFRQTMISKTLAPSLDRREAIYPIDFDRVNWLAFLNQIYKRLKGICHKTESTKS